jgi:hypothetical protein
MVYILSALGIKPWSNIPALQGSFLNYYSSHFQSLGGIVDFLTFTGPMWFLLVLLIFTALYTLWRKIIKLDSIQKHIPKTFPIPRYLFLLLLAIVLGCVTFAVRLGSPIDDNLLGIPFAFIVQYLMMFSMGVIIVRYDWLEKISKYHTKIWSITIATAIALFYLYFFLFLGMDSDLRVLLGGPSLHALAFALLDNIICMGMVFILIPIFYKKFNHQKALTRNLSSSAYHMYLIHAPILILVSLGFASIRLLPAIKLVIVFPLAVILCYLASHFVIKKIHQLLKQERTG